MKTRKKPIHVPRVISVLLLPLLVPLALVAAAISVPYTKIRRRRMARREDMFTESMKLKGRVMDWADFVCELSQGNGVLIVERFSFKGPVRLWWTSDDLYKSCPYPLVDWFTMAQDATFDPVRDWCNARYTGATGEAMLVRATKDQWRTISNADLLTPREAVQFVEIPPPRKS